MSHAHLTSGRLLARNTVWSLVGQFSPLAVAVVTIPFLLRGLGVARFGVLSLAWVLIGYFGLFDLGIGRALTCLVSDRLGANEAQRVPSLVWTSLWLLGAAGVVAGLIGGAISPWLVYRILRIPAELQPESLRSFYILAFSVPLVTTTSGLRGLLEAQQRFGLLAAIRVPMTIFMFVGPLLTLPFSHSLVPVIVVLVASRAVAALAHFAACVKSTPDLLQAGPFHLAPIVPILRYGGWITVSNTLNPVLIYMDRFLIGALLSMTAVSYYTMPFEVVSKLTLLSGAVVNVVLPAFTLSFAQDPGRTALLLRRSVKFVYLAVFPLALCTMVLAPEGLTLWLGAGFEQNSIAVLRWLTAGVFLNCLAMLPFALLQGIGWPKITAFLVLADIPVFFGAEWWLIHHYGVKGAAIAWTVRALVDASVLFFASHRLLHATGAARLAGAALAALALLGLGALPASLLLRLIYLGVVLIPFAVLAWSAVLRAEERRAVFDLWGWQRNIAAREVGTGSRI